MERRVKIITQGCRLNAYESEIMAGHAQKAGLRDAVIVNTCAVTNEAVRQGKQTIRKMVRENPDKKIIVTGCAAQIDPKTYANLEGVDHVWGNREKMRSESFALKPTFSVSDIMKARPRRDKAASGLVQRARAIVQIQNGCDHRCTFCIIPYGRGNSRSQSVAQITSRVAELTAQGFNEVVLTGVDLSSWGDDMEGRPRLGHLVGRILRAAPDLSRLRLSSIDSAEIDDELMELFASQPRLAPYLHLSLQHGDNMILKRMKRRHSREDAVALTQKLRKIRPDISFGADIIAGFPTESEAMFENSLSLVRDCNLAWLHVFPYSARRGTPAARMPQVDGKIIKARAARLREAGDAARRRHLKARAFGHDMVLVESENLGRLADFTPIKLPPHNAKPGALHPIHIIGYDSHNLLGEFA